MMALFLAGMLIFSSVQGQEVEIPQAPTYEYEPIETLQDAYYVEFEDTRIIIFCESGDGPFLFSSMKEMFIWLNMRTVTDNQIGYDCLNPEQPEEDYEPCAHFKI